MTDAESVDLELRELTWRDLANDAYKTAESVVKSLSVNWMPEPNARAMRDGKPLSIDETAELLQERLELLEGRYAYLRSMFGRMGPLLDDMDEFTIPAHPVYYSWYPGMETVIVPESEYQAAWKAIADVESRIAFWNLMATDHYREASHIAEKPEEERTPQEIDRLQRYRDRQSNNPFHPHIKKLILDRLRKEQARIKRDFAIGLADELAPPALDPLYDTRPKREGVARTESPEADEPNVDKPDEERDGLLLSPGAMEGLASVLGQLSKRPAHEIAAGEIIDRIRKDRREAKTSQDNWALKLGRSKRTIGKAMEIVVKSPEYQDAVSSPVSSGTARKNLTRQNT
ncbi:hypothetical protein [Novipirellula rosea]